MKYTVTVFVDCPRCGAEAEVAVAYEGKASRHQYGDTREMIGAQFECPNYCAGLAHVVDKAVVRADRSLIHAECVS